MDHPKITRGALLTNNLPQLQNLIKRDPEGYREEFLQQWTHYESIRKIFEVNLAEQSQSFREIVTFISQVAQCYPTETSQFFSQVSTLLKDNYLSLNPDLRKSLVSTLVLLRNKDVTTSLELLKALFPLLSITTSSTLRSYIRKTILSDIRRANVRTKNQKLNRAVQAMLFRMVEHNSEGTVMGDKGKAKAIQDRKDGPSEEALWAVLLTKELWKKGVWHDTKSVSIISLGCFHPVVKVQNVSIHFFLTVDEEDDSDDDENEGPSISGLLHRRDINKKTRSGDKKLHKKMRTMKNKTKKRSEESATPNFPALQMLHDPQTFGEKLYDNLDHHDKRYSLDHKILIMQLLGRTMGVHKLCILGFYTYIIKYLTYRQLRIPSILVCLAQSVHDLTPPDVLAPVIRKISQEFIHPGVGSEVIVAGLNAIREVCRRQPWCMEEDLLGDLIEYRKSKDKAVVTSARSLLQLFREVNPGMLKRRERGKEASTGNSSSQAPAYGHSARPAEGIDGLHLLEEHLKSKVHLDGEPVEEGNGWDGWEVESDTSETSSEGWIDVDSEGEDDIMISDSEGETERNKKPDDSTKHHPTDNDVGVDNPHPPASTMATSKILTPADYVMLNDLKIKAAQDAVDKVGGSRTKRKLAALVAQKSAIGRPSQMDDTFVSENDILGPRKKAKANYEERMESIRKGREGREKFGSNKGKKMKEAPSSSTNREKAKNKPIMMVLASKAVRGKKKASLRDKQKRLRAHVDKAKKAYH